MRHRHLWAKALLVITAVSLLKSQSACNFTLSPVSEVPSSISETVESLEITVDTYADEYFKNEDLASVIAEDLKDISDLNGYSLVKATLVRVVDGDTLVVDIDGEESKIRLIGINTPESVASKEYLDKTGKENTTEGKQASEWVKNLLKDNPTLYLQKDTSETDKYGRTLRYVWLEVPKDCNNIDEIRTKMLNGILLENNLAEVTIYKPDTKYADEFLAISTHTTDDWEIDR